MANTSDSPEYQAALSHAINQLKNNITTGLKFNGFLSESLLDLICAAVTKCNVVTCRWIFENLIHSNARVREPNWYYLTVYHVLFNDDLRILETALKCAQLSEDELINLAIETIRNNRPHQLAIIITNGLCINPTIIYSANQLKNPEINGLLEPHISNHNKICAEIDSMMPNEMIKIIYRYAICENQVDEVIERQFSEFVNLVKNGPLPEISLPPYLLDYLTPNHLCELMHNYSHTIKNELFRLLTKSKIRKLNTCCISHCLTKCKIEDKIDIDRICEFIDPVDGNALIDLLEEFCEIFADLRIPKYILNKLPFTVEMTLLERIVRNDGGDPFHMENFYQRNRYKMMAKITAERFGLNFEVVRKNNTF